jgi:hypothetical protein
MDLTTDNELGEMANACAAAYCNHLDGLDLWLSMYKKCFEDTNTLIDNSTNISSSLWSPIHVGIACAISSIIGLLLGIFVVNLYERFQRNMYGYTEISDLLMDDDIVKYSGIYVL